MNTTFSDFVVFLWQLLPAYFPLSLPVIQLDSPVALYYLQKRSDVKAGIQFGMLKQVWARKEAFNPL